MSITDQPSESAGADAPSRKQSAELREKMDARFRKEVDEANYLLEWAVATGKRLGDEEKPATKKDNAKTKDAAGGEVDAGGNQEADRNDDAENQDSDQSLVMRIKRGYDLLDDASVEERADFESAYQELTTILAPVTYRTLAATSDELGRDTFLAPMYKFFRKKRVSEARIWSKKLWLWTITLLLAVMIAENLDDYLDLFAPADSQSIDEAGVGPSQRWAFWLAIILPFLYGALGACAYLLRSCHKFMHKRTFDPDRIPEYFNRGLLGFLAGGAILLFTTEEGTLIGADTPLSGAALAFLAGYSTDFLYTTLERIAAAVMPKEVKQPASGQAGSPTPGGGG